MTPEERETLNLRVVELKTFAEGEPTAAAIILLGDRLVGVLDGVLARLRAIEDRLDDISREMP